MRAQGIDVSGYQKVIDWEIVAKEGQISFCFVKTTEGRGYTSELWVDQSINALKAGIITGLYHYAQLERNAGESIADDAQAEAVRLVQNHVRLTQLAYQLREQSVEQGHEEGESLYFPEYRILPPVLDLEDPDGHNLTGAEVREWAEHFVQHVYKLLGYYPVLYTGKWYLDRYQALLGSEILLNCPLWMAKYPTNAAMPNAPVSEDFEAKSLGKWEKWWFWQYGGHPTANTYNRCPGVKGLCDRNVFRASVEALRAWVDNYVPHAVFPPES
jgi:GH25 family lysozyme M1 (1,4-beta-N-acetylmuramidase)